MGREIDLMETWEQATEAINCVLGLGFGPDSDQAQDVFREIGGDFGIPTDSDVSDFIALVNAMDTEIAPSRASANTAKDGVLAILRLYQRAAASV